MGKKKFSGIVVFVFCLTIGLVFPSCSKGPNIDGYWNDQKDDTTSDIWNFQKNQFISYKGCNHPLTENPLYSCDSVNPPFVFSIEVDLKVKNNYLLYTRGQSISFSMSKSTDGIERMTVSDGSFLTKFEKPPKIVVPSAFKKESSPAESPPSEISSTPSQQPTPSQQSAPSPQPTNPQAWSPSFNCANASTSQEQLICSSQELSEADVKMAETYKKALSISADREKIKAEQRKWMAEKRNKCGDAECILKAYNDRMFELASP